MTGESSGPASTPPVSPAESVVQPGDFPRELTDDQLQLQLMNNWKIQNLVEGFSDAIRSPLDTMESIRAGVRNEVEHTASLSAEQRRMRESLAHAARDERIDTSSTSRFNNAREEAAKISETLEKDIQNELQIASDEFTRLADEVLNATSGRGQEIRSDIARLDAKAVTISTQLDQLRQKMKIFHVDLIPGDASRIGLAAELDASDIPPPSSSAVGYETLHESWANALRDMKYNRPYQALINAQGNLLGQYRQITVQYPSEYKRYQRILGGYATEEEPIDWWNIVSTVGWFIATEAAFVAAGMLLAPITGGIGTAVLYSARMAARAGALGRMAASGIRAGRNVAVWFARLEQRLWGPVDDAFQNALNRLRGRPIIKPGQPGSQVNGRGQKPDAPTCPIGACVL